MGVCAFPQIYSTIGCVENHVTIKAGNEGPFPRDNERQFSPQTNENNVEDHLLTTWIDYRMDS